MRKLVGGDYLLDLTPIELEESEDGETYTNITNKEIIEQLTNLKKFVPNPSMVKPVWVKLINGETDEIVVVRGEFKVVDADEFEIVVAIDGYKLKIHIEFTQALNENNDPIDDWYIDTNDAKYLFTSDAQNIVESVKNEDVVVKTLKQTQPNYSLDISELPVNDKPANLDYECVYGKVEEINGVLYIVWTCKWINNTEETITLTNMSLLLEVNEDIAKRIIDFDGKSVNESSSAEISADVGFKGDATYPIALNRIQFGARITNSSAVNKMYLSVYIGGGTISAGQTQLMSFRTFLTLL